ncbi:DUF6512 family protein [uncultured Oscillibacter sp.]|uniref:DUF6512 family protein n=1 Tax=uncultured Oscillibacter sp. TaxID=876091 RepID=UPI00280597A8|nr:DUF6512 family protein [uncultured Oscillibacter sp.]
MLVRKRGIWREALLTGYTVLLGSLLHFVYGWSGSNVFAAGFSAVNESTWEHMKLLFFPVFLLTLLQTCTRRAADTCIPAVRAISVFIGLSLIPMLYYTYTGIVGTHALWADIAVFILAAAGTFAADSLLTRSGRLRRPWQQIAGMLALWALAFCFVWCTFRPPQLALWLDPVTGRYGL